MTTIMGLDASSSTVGLCVLSYDDSTIKLDHVEFIKPSKDGTIFEILLKLKKDIQDRIDKFNPDEYAIEDIVLFMKGKTTARTVTLLAIFNRTVGLTIFDKTNKLPYLYNALKIRHAIKLSKDLPPKKDIPELVAKILNISFPYITKINRRTKIVENKEENEDMADAIAVALAHIIINKKEKLKQEEKAKKKIEKDKKKNEKKSSS